MGIIKILRRSIIAICLLIIIQDVFMSLPEGKYLDKNLKSLINENKAQVIEVGKSMKIDNDTILIKRIINTQDNTCIRYAFIRFEQGWSFPDSAIRIFDDKGKEYICRSGEAKGKLWGQDALIQLEKVDKSAKYLTFRLEWYDRKDEITIPLEKEGKINEHN